MSIGDWGGCGSLRSTGWGLAAADSRISLRSERRRGSTPSSRRRHHTSEAGSLQRAARSGARSRPLGPLAGTAARHHMHALRRRIAADSGPIHRHAMGTDARGSTTNAGATPARSTVLGSAAPVTERLRGRGADRTLRVRRRAPRKPEALDLLGARRPTASGPADTGRGRRLGCARTRRLHMLARLCKGRSDANRCAGDAHVPERPEARACSRHSGRPQSSACSNEPAAG